MLTPEEYWLFLRYEMELVWDRIPSADQAQLEQLFQQGEVYLREMDSLSNTAQLFRDLVIEIKRARLAAEDGSRG